MTPILIKSFLAAAAMGGNLIARAAANGQVQEAGAATHKLIGVTDQMGAAEGRMADVVQLGWAELRLGGAVSFGDALTSDDAGRGVEAVPTPDAIVRTVAIAMSDGVENDIIPVYVTLGLVATPAEPDPG